MNDALFCPSCAGAAHFTHRDCACDTCAAAKLAEQLADAERVFGDEPPICADIKSDRIAMFAERMAA